MFLYFLLLFSVVKNSAGFFGKPMRQDPPCSNINITIYPTNPLPSQEIRVVAVCASLGSTPMPCPTCTVEDPYMKYYLGKIITFEDGERCSTNFKIYVDSDKKKTDLKITCRIGYQSFTKRIIVEKSKNNSRCYKSVDCMYSSQECICGVCTCPNGTFFNETKQNCYQRPYRGSVKPGPAKQNQKNETACQECQNFTISIDNRVPLFSDVVSVDSSCTIDTKKCSENRLYPALDFISPDVEIIPVRNVSYYIGPECFSHVDFTFGKQYGNHTSLSGDLRVTVQVRVAKIEFNGSLYVHTNNYGGGCRQDRDCKGQLQCHDYRCLCSQGYEYVPDVGNCFPSVSRLYGTCSYSEQCSFRGSICWQGRCQCQPGFWLDTNSDSCVQEGRSLGETCELDRHCKLRNVNSICNHQICTCSVGWERYGECVLITIADTASSHQIGFLNIIAMIIISLKFGIWKFKN